MEQHGISKRMEAIRIKLSGDKDKLSIRYRVYVQNYGWLKWVEDGDIAGTVGKSKRIEAIEIKIVEKGKSDVTEENNEETKIHVTYDGFTAENKWQDYWNMDGGLAGTDGKSLSLERIKIELINAPSDAHIAYRTHGEGYGWQSGYSEDGQIGGSINKHQRMEGIQIWLVNMEEYSIEYRAQIQDYGWLDWVVDGELAGTTGLSKRLEGLQIRIIKKRVPSMKVTYQAQGQDYGWQNEVSSGIIAGDTSKRLEGIKIKLENAPADAKIQYQAQGQDYGWQSWVENGELAGTVGQSKRLEGIRIKLVNLDKYSIIYNTYAEGYGWQGWAIDGELAGTVGQSRTIKAIKIKIVKKSDETKSWISIDYPSNGNIAYKEPTTIRGWAMDNTEGSYVKLFINGNEISSYRVKRQDILDTIKGYGGEEKNPTPGFEAKVDFSDYNTGEYTLTAKLYKKDGSVLQQTNSKFNVKKRFINETGTYGRSGLAIKRDSRGSDLRYYKIGNGPNVFFAVFEEHGFEDLWWADGNELVQIAENFRNRLVDLKDENLSDKWTIYIIPQANPDGVNAGYTNNGPGRTTLYSEAPEHKGIDMNRNWHISGTTYKRYTSNRNYNGTEGFQAYEARYLRDFLLSKRATNGARTVLVELHGWTTQAIGDEEICSYYRNEFPTCRYTSSYGVGYLINWARNSLGSNGVAARSALIELPSSGIGSHNDVVNNNYSNKFINATINLLKNM